MFFFFFFSSRRRHTRWTGDWSSDVCSSDLDLDAGIEVFGVLADDDQVDVVEAGAHTRVRLAGAHLRVQVEALAQGDVDRAEAAADRGRDRAFRSEERRVGKECRSRWSPDH